MVASICVVYIHEGILVTSAVTTQLYPRPDNAPRRKPHGNAKYYKRENNATYYN